MDGQVATAPRCARCEAPGLTFGRAIGGVVYLRDPDGAEHAATCSGARFDFDAETPSAEPIPAAPVVVVVPEVVDDAEAEALARDDDERESWHEATRAERAHLADWPDLRRAILAYGGIGPSPDFPRDWYPADLYRVHGKAPDVVAAEVRIGRGRAPWAGMDDDGRGDGDDSAMFAYLQRSWADWQQLQQDRRPRSPRSLARTPREALTPTEAPVTDLRAAVLSMARLVADVADLVAAGAAPANLARQVADAARTLAEATQ